MTELSIGVVVSASVALTEANAYTTSLLHMCLL